VKFIPLTKERKKALIENIRIAFLILIVGAALYSVVINFGLHIKKNTKKDPKCNYEYIRPCNQTELIINTDSPDKCWIEED
jgi:hypothetical protein